MTERASAKEIVDAAFRMQTPLGPGLLESIYQTALAYELGRRGLRTMRPAGVNGLQDDHAKSPSRQEGVGISSASPWDFKEHPWLSLALALRRKIAKPSYARTPGERVQATAFRLTLHSYGPP